MKVKVEEKMVAKKEEEQDEDDCCAKPCQKPLGMSEHDNITVFGHLGVFKR